MFTVLVITYQRREILRQCIDRVVEHITPQHIVVADDGSTDGTQSMVASSFPGAVLVQSHRAGLGGNANAGLSAAFALTDVVLQIQDDHHLHAPILDLQHHAETLRDNTDCGWIRLANVHNHNLRARMYADYWRVDWDSPGIYIASDQPHIKHLRFHDEFGWYPERACVADTENTWCATTRQHGIDTPGAPEVWVPVYLPPRGVWWHNDGGSSHNAAGR